MQDLIIFDRLKDKIFICAPASGGSHIRASLDDVVAQFSTLGLQCIVPDNLFNDENSLRHIDAQQWLSLDSRTILDNAREGRTMWCANTLAVRTAHFKYALEREDIRLILFLKGGYGSGEVAYALEDLFLAKQLQIHGPKIVVAYSDGTFMLNYLAERHGLIGIHGPMINSLARNDDTESTITESMQRLYDLLVGADSEIALTPLNDSAQQINEVIESKLAGGNLACLCSGVGTILQVTSQEKILILEDINSKGYQIMRDLLQLKQANILNKTRAIIFGTFTNGDNYSKEAIMTGVRQLIEPHIPCFSSELIGHTAKNLPWPLGGKAKISQQRLRISSPFRLQNALKF